MVQRTYVGVGVWDATCTDTHAPNYFNGSVKVAGSAANTRAKQKTLKYKTLIDRNYYFVSFAVETMGPWGAEAIKIVSLKDKEPRSRHS